MPDQKECVYCDMPEGEHDRSCIGIMRENRMKEYGSPMLSERDRLLGIETMLLKVLKKLDGIEQQLKGR